MKSNNSKDLIPWQLKNSSMVFEDRWIRVRADECLTANGVTISPFYVLEYPNWVHMVVINDKNQILITEQYRHGAKTISMELPCGTQDKNDVDELESAKRELLEETGFTGDFIFAGRVSPNPATHNNSIFVYLIKNPRQVAQTQDDPSEVINYQFVDLNDVYNLIDNNQFPQALHIASLFLGLRKNESQS